MNRTTVALLSAGVLAATASSSLAWEVRYRFVERLGTTDVVLRDNRIDYSLISRRIRLQIGVFDDAAGAAPAGGIYGMLDVSHIGPGIIARRTPGLLGVFANALGNNGDPATDPYQRLTNIDAAIGPQNIAWNCSGGSPAPQPAAVIRGRNTFISVFEMTITPDETCRNPRVTLAGSVLVASDWSVSGTPVAPVCTEPPTPGNVTYSASVLDPVTFSAILTFELGPPPPPPWPPYTFCPIDWNHDLALTSSDFFEFLADFFTGFADVNCDAITNSADFFYFLELFFTDCVL